MAAVEADSVEQAPALQVIILGSGGGPIESNVTATLIRSVSAGWGRASMSALDAGVHMAAITRILEETQPHGLGTDVKLPHVLQDGPFKGMEVRSASAVTNAAHIVRHCIDTVLITHPHLDHISAFVINTAGFQPTRAKRLAGLPSTISAFKTHIFNNVIWPNLSDENNGAGLVTYMRLVEGGSPALGEGDGKGYVEISEGLTVKVLAVSHGHCIERHAHRGSSASSRLGSMDGSSMILGSRQIPGSNAAAGPASLFRSSLTHSSPGGHQDREHVCVYDSSAYFIRDAPTGREVLMFGDVEPDSVSLSPRNLMVWQEAAPRIARGDLAAIFIECSFDDSQTDDRLFGHLTPRYVMQELKVLAAEVELAAKSSTTSYKSKLESYTKKRKRELEDAVRRANRFMPRSTVSTPVPTPIITSGILARGDDPPLSPKSTRPLKVDTPSSMSNAGSDYGFDTPHISTPTAEMSLRDLENPASASTNGPSPATTGQHQLGVGGGNTPIPEPRSLNALKGVKVVIIHVKERLTDDEPAGDRILRELQEHEAEAQTGAEFVVSHSGQSFYI
ncbi:cAMP phosphodiesterases class-II-domain-containing protein [Microdochium trichocladiopsis]|uniref:cAMP phosphodiesterases class-II-domain-containing protein n=1 Tax=Microdochium trichocladiopsis TaxID=1682393 RepID=A0A9P8YF06_9PEZI|nr:cAMP phosphodiesterases class-II-domain-containing protein [Microdochium trichocladiopsis]KAH7038240.1 cAMP phosphodiesterases class-II-domain-containing protein [Microdochium trichocladiopsis]